MKMKRLLPLLLLLPLALNAQQSGVRFERVLSWPEVQAKANAANKHILLVVCASRSQPCKPMDDNVFLKDSLAAFVNDKFIVVRVQGDTSAQDDAEVKSRYGEARAMVEQYKVGQFPTFLFFSPDGKLVHRATGNKNLQDFLALTADALNPARQYYVQLEQYERGVKDYGAMMYLAQTARALNERDIARRIASEYIDHLSADERYSKDNIRFIARFTEHASDPGFAMFHEHADTVDRIVDVAGFGNSIADRVITRDEIDPVAFPGGKPSPAVPNWTAITSTITAKFGTSAAERTVLDAQIRWNEGTKNWPELSRYTVLKLEKYGSSLHDMAINNHAWDLFLHTSDKKSLETAIRMIEQVAKKVEQDPTAAGSMGPAFIDTYANLLYKAGKTGEAVTWEEKAVKLTPQGSFWWEAHTGALAKMKKREPTWPPNSQ